MGLFDSLVLRADGGLASYPPDADYWYTPRGETTPALARNSLVQLTGLMGLAAEHLRECELAYKHILVLKLSQFEKANRAKIEAEATSQYADFREAKDVHASLDQMTMSCKAYLRSLESELRGVGGR